MATTRPGTFWPMMALALVALGASIGLVVMSTHETEPTTIVQPTRPTTPHNLAEALSALSSFGMSSLFSCGCEGDGAQPETETPPVVRITVDANGKADYAGAYKAMPDWETKRKEQVRALLRQFPEGKTKAAQDLLPEYNTVCKLKDQILAAMNTDNMKGGEEIVEIANALAMPSDNVDWECAVTFFSVMYEVAGGCTSMVMNDKDGSIVHGRNLDYSAFPIPQTCKPRENIPCESTIADLTITAQYVKNGKLMYEGPTYIGYIGTLTGQAAGRLTVSLNQRYPNGDGHEARKLNFAIAFPRNAQGEPTYDPNYMAPGLWIRQYLSDPTATFAVTKDALTKQDFITPAYVTLGGVQKQEGCVTAIGRNHLQIPFQSCIGDRKYPCGDDYCLITNYDSTYDVLNKDTNQHEHNRYFCGVAHAASLGATATAKDVFNKVMKQCMTFVTYGSNSFATTFSTVMSAGQPSKMQVVYQPYSGPPIQ